VKLAVGSVVMIARREVSGKRDSNPRHLSKNVRDEIIVPEVVKMEGSS